MTVQARWNSDIQCHVVALDVLTDEEDHVGFVEKRHEERVVPILVVFHLWIVGLGFFSSRTKPFMLKRWRVDVGPSCIVWMSGLLRSDPRCEAMRRPQTSVCP